MFILRLNDMRAPNIENTFPIFRAETAKEIEDFLEKETVQTYTTDNRWQKTYRKDGPLEWYNPPFSFDQHIVDAGSANDWAKKARANYDSNIMSLPTVISNHINETIPK